MGLREEIIEKVKISIEMKKRKNEDSKMCNLYVADIFKDCEINIKELNYTTEFLPLKTDKPVDFTFSCCVENQSEHNLQLPDFTPGDIVVFYSTFSQNNISHVMIALDEKTLVGTNSRSTFEPYNGEYVSLNAIYVADKKLDRSVLVVRAISPDELVKYHGFK